MRRCPLWTLLVVPVVLSCNDAMAPRPGAANLRGALDGPSLARVVGTDAQFVSAGTCGGPSNAQAIGEAIDEGGRMAFNVQWGGVGPFFMAFACLNEGFNSVKLFTPPNTTSRVRGMNDSKWLVGDLIGPNFRAVVWRPDNTLLELTPALGNPARSRATDINNNGDVIGVVEDGTGGSARPFIAHIDLATGSITGVDFLAGFNGLGASTLTPVAINESRQVVGVYVIATATTATVHAFLWDGGLLTDLGSQIESSNVLHVGVTDINNHGQIVGYYDRQNPGGQSRHAVIWENGRATELPPVGNATFPNEFAEAINDAGVIVGRGNGGTLIWKGGEGSAIGGAGGFDINESNQVAGFGLDLNIDIVAIRWTRIAFDDSPPTNRPPVPSTGGPYVALEGTDFAFNGGASMDPDGDAITYDWDFDDGSLHSTEQSPIHAYADEGVRNVTLVVSDGKGGTASATTTVTVENVAPTMTSIAGATLIAGETFTASGSFIDPGADSWTATVNYGEGAGSRPLDLSGKSFQLANSYLVAGTYTVTVTVTDGDGGVTSVSTTVTVQSPSQAAQAATTTIANLVASGEVTGAEASSLNASLLSASATLARGNTTAGVNQLEAFKQKVDAMLQSGRISAETAQALVDAAQRIINQT